MLEFRRHGNARQDVDELSVVGNAMLPIRIRPVGAPEHMIRITLDERPNDFDKIVERRMQIAEPDYIVSSTAAQTAIAENYVGLSL